MAKPTRVEVEKFFAKHLGKNLPANEAMIMFIDEFGERFVDIEIDKIDEVLASYMSATTLYVSVGVWVQIFLDEFPEFSEGYKEHSSYEL